MQYYLYYLKNLLKYFYFIYVIWFPNLMFPPNNFGLISGIKTIKFVPYYESFNSSVVASTTPKTFLAYSTTAA